MFRARAVYSGVPTEEGSDSSSGVLLMKADSLIQSVLFTFLSGACTLLHWLVQHFEQVFLLLSEQGVFCFYYLKMVAEHLPS